MPRYPTITPEQEKKVLELVGLMKKAYDPLPPHLQSIQKFMTGDRAGTCTPLNPIREYCYCFLISREWDVQKAFEMMKLAVGYRERNQLDHRAEFPAAFSCKGWDQDDVQRALSKAPRPTDQRLDRLCAGIAPFFSFGFHKWDKYGQPVLYMEVGSIDEAGLLKKLKQMANIGQTGEAVMWEIVQHSLGIDEQLQYYQQMRYNAGALQVDAADGLIRSTTLVIDLKGLTYKMLWKPALDLFMNTLRELFQYYSQCVYQILIVNSPAMVMFAYKIVRGVLPPGVQRKVHIVDAQDTPATMRKFIDEVNVPDFYGGTCRCPGGCIEGYGQAQAKRRDKESVSSASEEAANGEVGVVTEDIALKAGQEHRRVFTLKKGETVVWEFVTPSGNGVTFAKYFEPSNEAKGVDWERVHLSKVERYVISKESPSEGSDEYTAGIDGVLVLVWDNKQSWFSAKHLQMKVFKQASEQTSA